LVLKYPSQPLAASVTGIALVQLSNLAFAFGQLAYKRIATNQPQWRDREAMAWLYVGGVIATTAAALASTDFPKLTVSPTQWLTLAYLGVVASGVCFFLWNVGARRVNEGTLAVMNNLKIPLGIVATLLVLHELTDYTRLTVGFMLMLVALGANEGWVHRTREQARERVRK
jgi:drug/metabolite transporter (DMT)-like permease